MLLCPALNMATEWLLAGTYNTYWYNAWFVNDVTPMSGPEGATKIYVAKSKLTDHISMKMLINDE
jgi:hypothetical protein